MKKAWLGLIFSGTVWGAEMQAGLLPDASKVLDPIPFPEGCGRALQDVSDFFGFFEATSAVIAAKNGAQSRGVTDLFSVIAVRTQLASKLPLVESEALIDQLVIAQLCQFRALRASQMRPGISETAKSMDSYDVQLHQHLIKIAPRLYADARKVLGRAVAKEQQAKSRQSELRARLSEIERARAAATERVLGLLKY